MKNILIVTDFYEPHISGITKYISLQIKYLISQNYKVTILTTKHKENLKKYEVNDKLNIIRANPNLKISRGFFSLDLCFLYLKNIKKHDLIFIHFPLTEIGFLNFFLPKNKIFFFYHCIPTFDKFFLKIFKSYFYFFSIFAMRKSKKIIFLSLDYAKNIELPNDLIRKSYEIPPYVNTKKIKKKIDPVFKIGYLGRISFEKNLELLISSSIEMSKKNIQHELLIAGDDQDKRFKRYTKKLKKLSSKYSHIAFIGKLSEKEKYNFLKRINVFVLPSNNSLEAFGIVQLEAMSCNTPVVVSNLPGVRTIVNKTNNGYIFLDKEDLIKKIIDLYNNKIIDPNISNRLKKYYCEEKFKLNMKHLIS